MNDGIRMKKAADLDAGIAALNRRFNSTFTNGISPYNFPGRHAGPAALSAPTCTSDARRDDMSSPFGPSQQFG
jgi:hypothetical protein